MHMHTSHKDTKCLLLLKHGKAVHDMGYPHHREFLFCLWASHGAPRCKTKLLDHAGLVLSNCANLIYENVHRAVTMLFQCMPAFIPDNDHFTAKMKPHASSKTRGNYWFNKMPSCRSRAGPARKRNILSVTRASSWKELCIFSSWAILAEECLLGHAAKNFHTMQGRHINEPQLYLHCGNVATR